MLNYYEVLGCNEDDSHEVLKQAYYRLMLKYHPDKLDNNSAKPKDVSLITEAWQTLKDSEQRKVYDKQLKQAEYNTYSLLYGTFSLKELTFDVNSNLYSYQCRCGGFYEFSKEDSEIRASSVYVECNECSLKICVLIKR